MRFPALIAVPAIALALAGCSAQEPATQPTTSTEVKPLFSSDEEALAAAEAAYANYLQVSDQIARDGGANPERLKGLVSENLYVESNSVFASYRENLIRVEGSTTFDSLHVAEVLNASSSFYVCLDVGQTSLLDSDGNDKTPAGREPRLPLVISLGHIGKTFIIESSEVWTGRNFC